MESLLTSTTSTSVSFATLLLWCAAALILGVGLAALYCVRNRHTRSFVVSLSILPAIVCVVIALVNGNVGTGVAVAGAFSLVRFRSAAGNARDIAFVFLAMCLGLACGMGELVVAACVLVLIGGAYLVIQLVGLGADSSERERTLTITVPEDLDFTHAFDDVLGRYTTEYRLRSTKTSGMGSLYKLSYNVTLAKDTNEKELIDELRCRNGNLEIALHNQEVLQNEL